MAHVRDLQFPHDRRGILSMDSPVAVESDGPRLPLWTNIAIRRRIFPPQEISIRSVRDSRRRAMIPRKTIHLITLIKRKCVALVTEEVCRDDNGRVLNTEGYSTLSS